MNKSKTNLFEVAKKVYCSSIKEIQPVFGEYALYEIDANGTIFEILTRLKKHSPILYVLGQGAIDDDKLKKYGLPMFQRWSWVSNFPYSVIILNDPTLHIDNLRVGWFQGTKEKYYLPIACEIIHTFLNKINLATKDVIFCGSSAGGFTSLMMATDFPQSSVFVNNPQTDIRKYYKSLVNKFLNSVFPDASPEEINGEQISTRLSVIEHYHSVDYIPNIYYVQNTQDTFHMRYHYMPFIEKVNKMILENSRFKDIKFVVELYSDETSQHNPLPKEEFMKRLKRVLFLFDKQK